MNPLLRDKLLHSDPYTYYEAAATRVYESLVDELSSATQIYIGGVDPASINNPYSDTAFLCKLFPDPIFIDDWRSSSHFFGRRVISTKEFASIAKKSDLLIINSHSTAGFNHFERQAQSLNVNYCSSLEAFSAFYAKGILVNFDGKFSVYGPSFHRHTLDHIETYRNLRNVFTDSLSLNTFDNLILYRLSGNPSFLHKVAVGYNYGLIQHDSYMLNKQFFNLGDKEVFIDAGAHVGDSSEYFIRSVLGNFERVVMFEPSPENVKCCKSTIEKLDQEFIGKNIASKCEIAESGLYSFTGNLSFANSLFDTTITKAHGVMTQSCHIIDTGLSSAFINKGDEFSPIAVPVTTLDQYLGNDPATFIKFEIEGSEVDALNGSRETILRNKPKMGLSIYHRPQDLELILNYVIQLNCNYKFALRAHNPNVPDAIVLYCWI